ncbi:siderophore ABC transporter substrate-binding protein [Rhodobacteraceae bacterium B1Z28]|uniref:Siderophore ABC transporter substrate-binding protein n=1 Tax=Ruegeria haliotis TaxID=2747601 RepID=A0ABX2PRJ1_9RHOB|nr:siderophore ABC transporter substrate-binding protein [Ruegeria haliotis]NVO56740.1 siderophore ABC transporter substrate-binding protein [Ruegeria haliotis]
MLGRLTALAMTALTASAGLAETLEIDTYRGPANVSGQPGTIAVFDVAAADTINALGVPIAGTVDGLYVEYLDDVARNAVDLGTFWEPDFEGVHALAPDLIVVGSRSSDQLDNMAKIAPSIDMTIDADLVGDAMARLRDYGRIFGKSDEAAALEQAFQDRLEQAISAAQGRGDVLIVMTNGPKISAYGGGGRFGWLHKDVGLPEAAPEISAAIHGEAISFEFVRDTDPDWLIVVDRLAAIGQPGDNAKATLDNALVQQTKAWQTGQVIYLNAADIYVAGGGIQSMMRTLDRLIAGFAAS